MCVGGVCVGGMLKSLLKSLCPGIFTVQRHYFEKYIEVSVPVPWYICNITSLYERVHVCRSDPHTCSHVTLLLLCRSLLLVYRSLCLLTNVTLPSPWEVIYIETGLFCSFISLTPHACHYSQPLGGRGYIYIYRRSVLLLCRSFLLLYRSLCLQVSFAPL